MCSQEETKYTIMFENKISTTKKSELSDIILKELREECISLVRSMTNCSSRDYNAFSQQLIGLKTAISIIEKHVKMINSKYKNVIIVYM